MSDRELITRNVAKLVQAPRVQYRETRPWSLDDTLLSLEGARSDALYPAFVLAVALGRSWGCGGMTSTWSGGP